MIYCFYHLKTLAFANHSLYVSDESRIVDSKGDSMRISKCFKRAGAFLLACVILVLFCSSVYLQANEADGLEHSYASEDPESYGLTEDIPGEGEPQDEPDPSGIAGAVAETEFQDDTSDDEEGDEAYEMESEVSDLPGTESDPAGASGTEDGTANVPAPGTETEPLSVPDAEPGLTDASGAGTEPADPLWAGSEPEMQGTGSEAGDASETESESAEIPETESELTELTEMESEEESELTLEEVLEQAEAQQIDFLGLAPGESLTFYTSIGQEDEQNEGIMRAAVTAVTVTRAAEPFWYSEYGYGTRFTYKYTVEFNGIKATAYCIRPSLASPGSSKNYKVIKLKGAKTLAKVCYYGTKAAGDEGFFAERYPEMNGVQRFIITHIAAAYANNSPDTFDGANDKAKKLAMELYDYCVNQPAIPEMDMAFSDPDVTAYIEGDGQRTKEITFNADELQSVTFSLPKGVKLHNVTTGETSKAGASVVISGGTKFYLSAPLTQAADVAPSWSERMKGSITKDYSAYKIITGNDTQDLALVFGEGVEDEIYIDFSVKWVKQAELEVLKTDSASGKGLQGAVFGVYSDEGCGNLIVQMPKTDEQGKSQVKLNMTQKTVYLKEIEAPAGYDISDEVYPAELNSGKTVSITVPNGEKFGSLTIYKEGEVLTGAVSGPDGTTFQYETRRLPGAVFNVSAAADIVSASGDIVYHAGDLVAGNLVTGAEGSVTLDGLHFGSYSVTETRPPANYSGDQTPKVVQVTAEGDAPTAAFQAGFFNERQKAEVTVLKVDAAESTPLAGAEFGLFADSDIVNVDGAVIAAKDTLLGKALTGADGNAKFSADIPIGAYYYVKETRAPENYQLSGDVFRFAFTYAGEQIPLVSFTHTFSDERISARLKLIKSDAQTGKAQGDATLEHAVYGLYAREAVTHPDGSGRILFQKDELIASLTTDANGEASIEDLYLGNYYVREISPSNGYLLDENEYDLSFADSGDQKVPVLEAECRVPETVICQPFQLIKIAGNGKSDADVLEGAGFSAYLASSLPKNPDGTYDFASAEPVVIGEGGAKEIFTDADGYAVSIPLPFGTYIVRETTVPEGFAPVDDFEVRIVENNPQKPQAWRVLLDEEFSAKLKIVKTDDETNKSVLEANTEFRVYDLDAGEYIEQVTTYPEEEKHSSYFTDEEGYLILPESLPMGHYRIEEVSAPDGYTIGHGITEVDVDSNIAYQMDQVSGDAVIEVVASNHPVKGELKIVKKGEVLEGYEDGFIYKEEPLAGAVYEVFAAEDIYTADFQEDGEGNRVLEYAQDSLVAELTTGENGEAVLRDLPLGAYRVVEKTAPDGYVLNETAQTAHFVYIDQDTPVVTEKLEFVNERQKAEISAVKRDASDGGLLAGAVFGIYAESDIRAGEKIVAKADTQLATAVTDENGKAVFGLDLPFGDYYIRELQAPKGFLPSDQTVKTGFSYTGQQESIVRLEALFENEPTIVEFTKSDITTGAELDGAVLSVLDGEGKVIDSWTSVKGQPHVIKGLYVGEVYTLREETAPYGYLCAEEVKFKVADTAAVQKVEMKDAVPVGRILISKTGEFVDTIKLGELAAGVLQSVFGYVWGALGQVTFEVYAAEDIRAADGVSKDYYKKDELVTSITTDALGYAETGDLPLGKYYVKEKATADGFVLDENPREIDLTYRDQNTPVVTYDEGWQNRRQRAAVTVLKKEKGTDLVLPGAVFALCAGEDIKSARGEVLIKADTILEQRSTAENGKAVFAADLPVGGTYYIKEIQAPAGFVRTDAVQEFTFTQTDKSAETISFDFIFENEATKTAVSKSDITTGEEIPGAKLQLRDAEGRIVEEWTSDQEPHMIYELIAGEKYTLREESAPKGYVTAEEVSFQVGDTGSIQSVEMKDDRAQGKLMIVKTDTDTGRPLKGAEFALYDEKGVLLETLVTDQDGRAESALLPIGVFKKGVYEKEIVYKVKEVKAPSGYQTDETEHEVRFAWEDGDTPVIECCLELENRKVIQDADAPKTGDSTDFFLPGAAMVCSGCILILLVLHRKKKVNKRLS